MWVKYLLSVRPLSWAQRMLWWARQRELKNLSGAFGVVTSHHASSAVRSGQASLESWWWPRRNLVHIICLLLLLLFFFFPASCMKNKTKTWQCRALRNAILGRYFRKGRSLWVFLKILVDWKSWTNVKCDHFETFCKNSYPWNLIISTVRSLDWSLDQLIIRLEASTISFCVW